MKPGDIGETAEPDPKATRNERVKLTSAWLNTIGAAAVTTGFIAPIMAYGLDVTVVPGSRMILLSPVGSPPERPTSPREMAPERAPKMTALEIYVFALPFIVLAGGAAMAYYASRADRERRAP